VSRDALPPIAWQDRVAIMLDDIARIRAFIGTLDREAFIRDDKTAFAVSYAFVRLGEGVGHVPEDVRTAHPQVAWKNVRHYRNFMIHVYQAVDPGRVFDTAKDDLDPLEAGLRALLKRETQ
jgi:uncharacterized protein with HEPN domain